MATKSPRTKVIPSRNPDYKLRNPTHTPNNLPTTYPSALSPSSTSSHAPSLKRQSQIVAVGDGLNADGIYGVRFAEIPYLNTCTASATGEYSRVGSGPTLLQKACAADDNVCCGRRMFSCVSDSACEGDRRWGMQSWIYKLDKYGANRSALYFPIFERSRNRSEEPLASSRRGPLDISKSVGEDEASEVGWLVRWQGGELRQLSLV